MGKLNDLSMSNITEEHQHISEESGLRRASVSLDCSSWFTLEAVFGKRKHLQVEIILKVKKTSLIKGGTPQPAKMGGSMFMCEGTSPGVEIYLWVPPSPLCVLRLSIHDTQASEVTSCKEGGLLKWVRLECDGDLIC